MRSDDTEAMSPENEIKQVPDVDLGPQLFLVREGEVPLYLLSLYGPLDLQLLGFHEFRELLELLVLDQLFDEVPARILNLVPQIDLHGKEHPRS